mmetsp:Transcript_24459/g.24344  ORF Transcript_24459/g.24344 Transcript_24459/m.24344 type:complete len:86 (-) Transcript_24459:28-285(-)
MSGTSNSQCYPQNSSHKAIHGAPYNLQGSKTLVWALKEILEIVLLIGQQAQVQLKEFVNAYNMETIITKTYHTARAEGLHQIKEL